METWGPLAKIGPPLRPAGGPDRDALWRGLEQGYIANVASDHSPRAKKFKEPGWKNIFVDDEGKPIPFGSPSLETLVPLVYSEGVVKRGLPLTWMARVLAENPARIVRALSAQGGDPRGRRRRSADLRSRARGHDHVADHHGMAGWTLYEGWTQRGRPWMTLLRGEVLLNQGRLEQRPGYGRSPGARARRAAGRPAR